MSDDSPLLEERLRSVSLALCDSVRDAIRDALAAQGLPDVGTGGDDELRPVHLTSKLGLDKSLASRIVRAVTSEDPLLALHRVPTPQGLALLARATRECGAGDRSLAALDAATERYSELLGEFSGGRTDLEATLSGYLPQQRARAERDARRSIFRGMTTLSGIRASAIYYAIYLLPSEREGLLDSVVVGVKQDMRRLRKGARLLVASLTASPRDDPERRTSFQDEPLDGRAVDTLLIRDVCSHPIPALEFEFDDDARKLQLCITPDGLDVNEFATLGFGWWTRGHGPRFAKDTRKWDKMTIRTAWPTEALVVDLFLHRDVVTDGEPVASIERDLSFAAPVLGEKPLSEPPPAGDWQRVEAPTLVDRSQHPSGLSSPKVRSCAAIAETTCREAGLDPSVFRPYRAHVDFPVASESLTLWWPLPETGR